MKKLTLPKTIVWNLSTGICFLILMSLLRIVFVHHFAAPNTSLTELNAAYLLGLRYDLRYVSIIMLLIQLLSFIKVFQPFETKRGKKIATSIWFLYSICLLVFYSADYIHYAYVHQRLNASILSYLDNAAISLQMMWQSYPLFQILAFIAVSLFLLNRMVQFTYRIISKRNNPTNKIQQGLFTIFILFVMIYSIVGNVVYTGGQYPLRWSDAYSLGSDFKANVALNPMQSFFSTLSFRTAKINNDLIKNNYSMISEYLSIPADVQNANNLNFKRKINPKTNDTISPKIKNVVLVICESFSAYKSSVIGNPLNATPYFNKIRKEGVFFNRAFSPAYGTARGVWATITGTPDVLEGKTSSRNPLAVDQHTIISDFKNYEKYYFLGGSTSWANIRGVLTNNISDLKIYEQGKYQSSEINVWGISDKDLFMEANKTLSANTKPFFAIIQTADNHRPYTIPAEDAKTFKKITISKDSLLKFGFENNDEFNAFRYTDFCFEQFIEAAKKESYFESTLFVFIGDHGIKGDAGNMLPRSFTEQGLTNMHVPFLFYAPKILSPKEYDFPVSQIDVLPSIASLCNIQYTNTTLGKNVFDIANNSNKNNTIFLYDDFNQQIGVLNNQYYFGYKIKTPTKSIFESVINNNKVTNDSAEKQMKILTETFYETSKYLLINNKKLNK
jgi:phosphoglycerol transferase MdoB-like AlkP superfamily enzyme